MMRPRGRPPMPSAISRPSEPLEMTSATSLDLWPMRMIEPFPKARSIWLSAPSSAFDLSMFASPNPTLKPSSQNCVHRQGCHRAPPNRNQSRPRPYFEWLTEIKRLFPYVLREQNMLMQAAHIKRGHHEAGAQPPIYKLHA